MDAALTGSSEVAFTIVSMTVSLTAVFIRVLFMGGVIGTAAARVRGHDRRRHSGVRSRLDQPTPMLAARFLRPPATARHGGLYMVIERLFDLSRDAYGWVLRRAMTHHAITMGVSALLVAATVWAFMTIPMGFIPSEDIGQIVSAQVEMMQGIGFDSNVAHLRAWSTSCARIPTS